MNVTVPINLETIAGSWIGDLRGTSLGNVFAESYNENGGLKFKITTSVRDEQTTFIGDFASINGRQVIQLNTVPEIPQLRKPNAVLEIDTLNEREINGRWSTVNGHSGVVWLKRVYTSNQQQQPKTEGVAALIARETSLPNLTVYRSELEILIAKMKALINTDRDVVITTRIDSKDVTEFASAFLKRRDVPNKLYHMRLGINDGRQPLQNSLNLVISNLLPSQFIVQSDSPIWLNGAHTELDEFFGRSTNKFVVFFQKYGLNVNGLVLLAAIATLPELSLVNRFIFLGLIVGLMMLFWRLHASLNSAVIYTDPDVKRGWYYPDWAKILTSVLGAALLAIAATTYRFLQEGGLATFLKVLGGFLSK